MYVEHLMYDTDTDDNQHFLFNFYFIFFSLYGKKS